jgi:hypothetical protein
MSQAIGKTTPRNRPRKASAIARTGSVRKFVPLFIATSLGIAFLLLVGEGKFVRSRAASGKGAGADTSSISPDVPPGNRVAAPEYDRQMRRVVFSLASSDADPELQDEVLRYLPSYTQILFLIPNSRLEEMENWTAAKPYGNRITLVTYDPQYRRGARLYLLLPDEDQLVAVDTEDFSIGTQHGTIWAQDLFEVARSPSGKLSLDTSYVHKCLQGMRNRLDPHVTSDNTYLSRLENATTTVRRLDLAFKGGNVLCDSRPGETIAFCGYDSVRSTRTLWSAFHGETLSDQEIVERFQKALEVDRVILAGPTRPQPRLLYHLDQAMLLLPDSVVAVSKVVGPTPRLEPDATQIRTIRTFLADLRATLQGLGYATIDIETPVENVLRYQHYVNAIPYVDGRTGRRTLLMPVFPATGDKRVVLRNTERFQALGYQVVLVPTSAYRLTGGIHCLVNVLE